MLAIASLTLHEALRRRVVAIAAAASATLLALTAWGFAKLGASGEDHTRLLVISSLIVILLAYMFSVMLAAGAALLAAPAIASEIDSGIVLAVLPRPLRRWEYVLGKWLGLTALVATFAYCVGAAELTVIGSIAGYVPPHPFVALSYLVAQSIALLSLALALSTRLPAMAAGMTAVAGFGLSWIAGIAASIADLLHNDAVRHAAIAVGLLVPTDGLWRGAIYALTPVVMLAAQAAAETRSEGNPFSVTAPPTPAFLVWTSLWVIAIVWGAIHHFAKRDI